MRLFLILQSSFETIYSLQKCLQHICFWTALLGNRIYKDDSVQVCPTLEKSMRTVYARTLKDLARFAGRSQAIAFDLTKISTVRWEGFVRYDYLSLST